MRPRLRLAALALAALLAPRAAAADPVGSYFYAAPYGGFTIFDGSLRVGHVILTDRPDFGARVGYQWLDWLAIEATGGLTPTRQDLSVGAKDVNYVHGGGGITFTPGGGRYGGPFVHLGAEVSEIRPKGIPITKQGNYAVAGGLRLWLTDQLGLRLEGRDLVWVAKDNLTKPITHTIAFSAGVVVALGATPRDTDGDGVPDRKDRCPATPSGARVDAAGCPIDSDGDAVFDGLDQCPNTPRGCKVDGKGCPIDADGDGVCDGLDQCPDTPRGATVDEKGCPHDADGDGVLDGLDQCPDTPKGCTVDEKGCPQDADGDGVCDGLDRCPDTASGLRVDKDGCPIEVTERETEMLDTGMIRLQNINFETGKADLPPDALPQLDIVGQLLTKWPELKIEIGGHTDSRGSVAYNQKLSEARMDSVLSYLIRRFPNLKAEQFTTMGYGESKPLVPNVGALNMAKNRRVEFKVMNTEVLKREVERRKLLKNN
jgi:outer membrane protein OmpA-like peptidoglycan-associated protein